MQTISPSHENVSLKGKAMKRLHVHVVVSDLQRRSAFILPSSRSAYRPKIRLCEVDAGRPPRAISTRGGEPGLDHLGIQVASQEELHEVFGRMRQAGGNI